MFRAAIANVLWQARFNPKKTQLCHTSKELQTFW
jgi:hypothetical protein